MKFPAGLCVVVVLLLSTLRAYGDATYAVGDRVQVTVGGGGAGTILEIGHGTPYEGYYKVHFDQLHHSDPSGGEWINPKEHPFARLNADGQPAAADAHPPAATAPAATTAANAPPKLAGSLPAAVDNDAPGSKEARFKALIRTRYPSYGGRHQVVQFHTFQIGGQSPFEYSYDAPVTRGHTYMAWRVRTRYTVTQRYDSARSDDILCDYDASYWIFKDIHGEWLAVQDHTTTSPLRYHKK